MAANKKNVTRVLHVDDDPSILEISKLMLMDMESNLDIDNACCVDEAFKKLETEHYDVVISDYEMPQKDGLQFLTELREAKNKIPFVLFTGKGREEVAIKALNLGASGYFNKQGSPETVYGELAHGIIQVVEHKKAVENLQDSELLTQKILSCSSNLIYIYDLLEKRNVYANREVADFLGYTSEQVQAMGSELFSYILHPDDAEAVAKHHARFADAPDNATYEVEYRMKHTSGDWIWLRSRDTLFARTPEGISSQILGTCEDISERKETERALIESEAHYRLLTENMRDVIWTMDLNGRFTYVSPSSLQIRGYTAEEAMHQSISQMLTPDSAQMVGKELGHFLETGMLSSNNFELEQYCKDGSTSWVEATVTILRDTNGKPSSLLGVSRDITERKKAEENKQLILNRLKLAQRISQVGIWNFDVSSGELFWDEETCRISGVSPELKPSLENFFKIVHPDDLEFVKEAIQGALEGKPYDIEMLILRPDGTERVVHAIGELSWNIQGKPSIAFWHSTGHH